MQTIRQKLIVFLVLPILGIGVVYFSISRYYTQQEFIQAIEQRAIDDSALITDRVKDATLSNDRITLTDLIMHEKYANTYIETITIYDEKGEVIAHTDLSIAPPNIAIEESGESITTAYKNTEKRSLFTVTRPLFSGLYRIGIVHIGFDFNDMLDTFNYTAYLFIGIGLLFLIGITLFVLKLSTTITRPIDTLKKTLAEFSSGNLSARIPVTTQDELGALAQSFNAMADALMNSNELLQAEKRGLEEKINELEKWQEATIGRELKMIELKKMLEKKT